MDNTKEENEFVLLAVPGKKIPVVSKKILKSKPMNKKLIKKCKEYAKFFKMV